MIRTKEFSLGRGEFFKILTNNYLWRRWWLFVLLSILASYEILRGYFPVFIISFTTFYLIAVVAYCWSYSYSKVNGFYFEERFFEFDDEFLTTHVRDGSFQRLKLDNIFYVVKTPNYYLLYIAKNLFVYLPRCAFLSDEDSRNFETILRRRKLVR